MLKKKKDPSQFANCFHCNNSIEVKWVRSTKQPSKKNDWEYWTEAEEIKDKFICDDCLVKLYHNHKWEFHRLITNKKKQTLLRQYIANGTVQGKAELVFCFSKRKLKTTKAKDIKKL